MKKKILSLVLSVLMVVTMLPTYAMPALAVECDHILTATDVANLTTDGFYNGGEHAEYVEGASGFIGAMLPASCTVNGWRLEKSADTGFCVICGKFFYNGTEITIPPTADDTVIPATGHEFTGDIKETATCEKAVQRECAHDNYDLEVIHNPGGTYSVKVNTVHCTVIDDSEVAGEEALGHDDTGATVRENFVNCEVDTATGDVVSNNCTTDGSYDEVLYCARGTSCDGTPSPKELSRDTVTVVARGHNYDVEKAAVEPTCTAAGNIEYKHCSNCNKYFDAEGNEITEAQTVVAALGHNYQELNRQDATCTVDGFVTEKCSRCGDEKVTTTPKFDHKNPDGSSAVTWSTEIEATCTQDGMESGPCALCDQLIRRVITAPGHQYTATAVQAPDCDIYGYTEYTCSVCQDTYKDYTNKLDHQWTTISVVAPTCTEDGYTRQECTNPASPTQPHYQNINPVPALGHHAGAPVIENCVNCKVDTATGAVVSTSCTEKGTYDEVVYCDRAGCGVELSREAKTVEPHGHNYKEDATQKIYPTCTEPGRNLYVCEYCGDSFFEDVPALGHQWELTDAADCVHGDMFVCTRHKIDTNTGVELTQVVGQNYVAGYFDWNTFSWVPEHYEDVYGPIECGATYEAKDTINYDVTFTANSGLEVGEDGQPVDYRDSNNAPYFNMQTGNQTGNTKFEIPVDEIPDDAAVYVSTTGTFDAATAIDYGTTTTNKTIEIQGKDFSYTVDQLNTGHEYNDVQYIEARCEYDAFYIVTCTRDENVAGEDRACPYTDADAAKNEKFVVVLPNTATGHRWSLRDDNSNIDPTCEKDGERHWVCLNDHNHQYTEAIPATGHNWVLNKTVAPTCCTDGYEEYICVNTKADNDLDGNYEETCGATYKVFTEPATGNHRFAIQHVEATCTTDGYDIYTCTNKYTNDAGEEVECGYSYQVATTPAKGHNYVVDTTVAATCTTEGYDAYKCSVCGEEGSKVTTTPALGHEYQVTDKVAATCTTEGYKKYECVRCDAEYTDITTPALGHEYKVTGTTPATCTTEGFDTYTCVRCDENYNKKTTPATGHQFIAAEFVAPTCTTDGYTVYECTNAGCTATYNGDFINAKDHSFVADVTAPSCTEGGYTTFTCEVCGEKRKNADGDVYKTDETKPVGHVFNDVSTVAPTCQENGKKVSKCINCGTVQEEVIPATGDHQYSDEITLAATCAADGVMTHKCDVCGESYTTVIPATGDHQYSDEVTLAATCGVDGVMTHKCDVCGESYTTVIPATGDHKYVAAVTTQPTCVSKGVMTYTCSVCGAAYTEEIAEIDDHQYSEIVTTPATCLEDGVMTHKCDLCAEEYTTVIPALGHDWLRTTYTRPTCIDCGYYTYECSRCGAIRTEDSEEPATGHDYVKTVTAATTKKAGKIVETCKNCGDVKKNAIPRIVSITLSQKEFVYTGKKINPLVTITNADGKKITTNNYDVKYENNVKIGKAKVTITFKNHYAGTVTRTFKIIPKTSGVSDITSPSKGKIRFTWGRVKVCDGYQIQYGTKSDFSGAKSVTVKGQKNCVKEFTGLKSGKKYYFRVRAYKVVDGKKIYGNWASIAKTVK